MGFFLQSASIRRRCVFHPASLYAAANSGRFLRPMPTAVVSPAGRGTAFDASEPSPAEKALKSIVLQ